MEGTLEFLQTVEPFNDLSERELKLLAPFAEMRVFEKGAYLMREGETEDTLFIIKQGQVEVVKTEDGRDFQLAVLGPKQFAGEMVLFDERTRSASVKALEYTEALVLSMGNIDSLSQEKIDYSALIVHLGKLMSVRLRQTNEAIVKSLTQELKFLSSHDQMGQLIIYILILLSFYFFSFKLFYEYASESVAIWIFSAVLIFMIGMLGTSLIRKSGHSLEFYGLTFKRWKEHTIEAVLITLPLLAGMVFYKWYMIHTIPAFKHLTVFKFIYKKESFFSSVFGMKTEQETIIAFFTLYILLIPIQEFVVRGCLQSCFHDFFRGANKTLMAIIASNLLFSMFHGLKSFSFMFFAFMLGCMWGAIYARQKSIVGPCVSHILVGVWAFCFLSIDSVLIY